MHIKNGELYVSRVYYKNGVLRENGILLTEFLTLKDISMLEFELIEDEEIDIQEVASIKYNFDKENYTAKDINNAFKKFVQLLGMQSDKINELARAVKQLDKRTRKEKE